MRRLWKEVDMKSFDGTYYQTFDGDLISLRLRTEVQKEYTADSIGFQEPVLHSSVGRELDRMLYRNCKRQVQ